MITKNNFIAVCIILLICFGISDMSFAQRHDDNNNTESRHGHKNKDKHEEDDDDDDKDKINKKPFWSLNGNDNVNAAKHFIGAVNAQSLNFRTNNLQRMTLTGEGRLGLGVVSPLELLHVGGSIKTDGQFLNTIFQTTDSSINVQGDIIASGMLKSGNTITVEGASASGIGFDKILASTGNLTFLKDVSGPFIIPFTADNINIGIGRQPLKKMHLFSQEDGDGSTSMRLEYERTTFFPGQPSGSIWDLSAVLSGGNTKFQISSPSNVLLTLTDAGKVGVNTTNPNEALDVIGNIRASGSVLADNININSVTVDSIHINRILTGGNSMQIDLINHEITTDNGIFSVGRKPMPPITNGQSFHQIKMGLGTTTPSHKLHLYGQNPTIRLQDAFALSGETTANFYLSAANGVGRLISDRSVTIFIDSDDDTDNEFFRIVKDQGAFNGENTLLAITEGGKTTLTKDCSVWGSCGGNNNIFEVVKKYAGGNSDLVFSVGDTGRTDIFGALHLKSSYGNADFVLESNNGHQWDLATNTEGSFGIFEVAANKGRFSVFPGGNIGIGGATNPTNRQAKLHVEVANDNDVAFAVYKGSTENFRITGDGRFFARGYRIKLGSFPDYVFNKDHKRMTFEERTLYYLTNKHLPGIASAKEIEKEGLDIGNTLSGLTFNVEEIALNQNDLYNMLLEQQRQMDELKKENELLKKEIMKLK